MEMPHVPNMATASSQVMAVMARGVRVFLLQPITTPPIGSPP